MRYTQPHPKPEPRPKKARKPWGSGGHWIRKRAPRRLSRAGSDPAYLDFVRSLPCFFNGATISTCEGRVHAHHAGRRPGVGLKADDKTAIPLCEKHHRAWHDARPPFAGLTKFERFAWSMRVIGHTQSAYQQRESRTP